MVAIVSGEGLGLSTSSLSTLKAQGRIGDAQQGRGNDRIYLNIANGNLVIQSLDEHLAGPGLAIDSLRTYNSQGQLNGEYLDSPLQPTRLEVQGGLNSANSRITRIDDQGHSSLYVWDGSRNAWLNTDGDGAYDSISYDKSSGTLTWTDGSSGVREIHQRVGDDWMLMSRADADGNRLDFSYDKYGRLISVINRNGEGSWYDYSGTPGNSILTQVRTLTRNGAGQFTSVRVRYGYDSLERITSITVDLSPDDASVADGRSYVTRYEYEGSSNRISAVYQDDGSVTRFGYIKLGSDWRIASFSNALGQTTRIDYQGNSTWVTDPLGLVTRYDHDDAGQLLRITAPAVNGQSQVTQFAWNGRGDLAQMTDARGLVTTMQYDANGNQVYVRDGAGNVLARQYSAQNLLLSETVYLVPDPDGAGSAQPGEARTTQYVYDSRRHLRFVISAEGRVTEYRYNATGQRISQFAYAAVQFNGSGARTEIQMAAWAATQDPRQMLRTDWVWDFRGQLQQQRTASALDASGAPAAGSVSAVTFFVYDRFGLLLQTISPEGGVQANAWDGLGRLLSSTDALGNTTLTRWDDRGNRVSVQAANGLLSTSVYDRAGRLLAQSDSNPQGQLLAATTYRYDADGRLISVQDPTGVLRHLLYDAAGRQVGEIDGRGALTETVYDADNQVLQTIRYANPVQLPADGDAIWSSVYALARLRPPPSVQDSKHWRIYDGGNRLVAEIDGEGALTRYEYDGAGRLLKTTRFAGAVNIDNLGPAPTLAQVLPPASSEDRVTRNFFDSDGLLRATLDAEGYLSEQRFDAAGQMVMRIRYARVTDPALRAGGTLAQLRPAADPGDAIDNLVYDARGLLMAQVDAESYLTRYDYDGSGHLLQQTRFAQALSASQRTALAAAGIAGSLRPAATAADQTQQFGYDLLGHLSWQIDAAGTVTRNDYDNMGRLIASTRAAGTDEARGTMRRYDLQGHVLAELSGEGSAALAALTAPSASQIEAVWNRYATRYQYDAAGRLQSQTDANGLRTLYYYDANGQLRYAINAMGEVEGHELDLLRNETAITRYATRLDAATLATLQGGLLDDVAAATLAQLSDSAHDAGTRQLYDRNGRLIASIDALGSRTSYRRDNFGQLTEVSQWVQGQNIVERLQWDRRGLQSADIADALGLAATTRWQYDAFGRVLSSTDANGNTRRQSWDRLGRQVQSVDALGGTQSSTWDAFSRELSRSDALGNTTRYVYDDQARSLRVTTPEGISVLTVRNRHGEVQQVVDGNGNSTQYRYDRNGNLVQIDGPLQSLRRNYDQANRLVESIDANGVRTVLSYDAASRVLTRTVDPDGLALQTRSSWDALGRQLRLESPGGTVTVFEYDRKGQLLSQVIDPQGLALTTRYGWDERGRRLMVTDANGVQTLTRWDSLGRRVEDVVDPSGLALTTRYRWDANGNLLQKIDANGASSRYVYDAQNQQVASIDGAGGVIFTIWDAAGRIARQVAYARAIVLTAQLASAPTLDALQSLLQADASDSETNNVYDHDGRLVYTVSGSGQVVALHYDGNGNLIERRAYAAAIDRAAWNTGTPPAVLIDDAHDLRQRIAYDAANRVIATLDGAGALSLQSWDGNGNLLSRTDYATAIASNTPLTSVNLALLSASLARPAVDRKLEYVYDAANRRIASRDGMQAVIRYDYDANGNLVRSRASANFVAGDDWQQAANSAADRFTDYCYDSANRLGWQVDAEGAVTCWVRDANGNVLSTTGYAHALDASVRQAPRLSASVLQAALTLDAAQDRVQRQAWDAANRLTYQVDAEGAVTSWRHDALGHALASVRYATPLSDNSLQALDGLASGRMTWIAAHLSTDTRQDRATQSYYDAAGHLLASVDALGYVTRNQVDALGRVLATTRNAQALASTPQSPAQSPLPSLAALDATLTPSPDDRNESWLLDANGRVLRHTDTLGNTELWRRDALGNALDYTNALGALWNYDYDAAGRQIQEIAPQVQVTAVTQDGNGDLVQDPAASGAARLVTRLAWDALGNLLARTEAAGRPEARTTRYQYDALGRQVGIEFPDTLVDPQGAAGPSQAVACSLQTATVYDALGNAVAGRDAAGQMSYKSWDRMGRLAFEVDALGQVTEYQRNAFGEVVQLIRYEHGISLSTQAAPGSDDIRATLRAGQDRSLQQSWDRTGRLLQSQQDAVLVFDPESGQTLYAHPQTALRYNAFGEQIETRQLQSASSGASLVMRNWYDQLGHLIASQDAGGYFNTQTWDGFGNVLQTVQYAMAQPGLDDPALLVPSGTRDRVVQMRWDAANRKLSQTQLGVEVNSDPDSPSRILDLVTRFKYDALGNLVATIDAQGNTSRLWYDALGRLVGSSAPARLDAAGQRMTPLISYGRDAFGNLALQREYAQGATAVDTSGFSATSSDADRVSLYHYDSHGHLLQSTDAQGASRYQSWDALGRLSQTWQLVHAWDGQSQMLLHIWRYDALGHVLSEIDLDPSGARSKDSAWNAFGELRAQGVDGVWDSQFTYDLAGRQWKISSNGLTRITVYDLQGNASIQLESDGSQPLDAGDALAALNATGTRRTDLRYDALGQLIQQTGPALATPALQVQGDLLRFAGAPGSTLAIQAAGADTWTALTVTPNADGSASASTADLPAGDYLWRLQTPGGNTLQGELHISAAQAEQMIPGSGLPSAGVPRVRLGDVGGTPGMVDASAWLAWGNGGEGSSQQFFYRAAGSDGDWSTLPVKALGDGYYGIDRRLLAAGRYDYRIVIDLAGGGQRTVNGQAELGVLQPVGAPLLLRDSQGHAVGATPGPLLQWNAPAPDQNAQLVWSSDGEHWQALPLQRETLGVDEDGKPVALLKLALDASWQEQRVFLQLRVADSAGNPVALTTGVLDWSAGQALPTWSDTTPPWTQASLRPAIARQVSVSGNDSQRATVFQRFDRWGNLLSRSDARNASWLTRWSYDYANRVLEESRPNGDGEAGDAEPDSVMHHYYDALGLQSAVRDARGNVTRYVYDGGQQLVEEHQADGGVRHYEYDLFGNQAASMDALGQRVQNRYDKLGRLLASISASGALIKSSQYDEAGRRIVDTNGAGEATRYRYDNRGNIVEVVQPLGQRSFTEWDHHDRRIAQTDALGRRQTWTWDARGWLAAYTDLSGALTQYGYDAAGQLLQQTNSRGQDLRNEYDSAGRLLRQTDVATQAVSEYGYDAAGNRIVERTIQAGILLQDNRLLFDAQNRMREVSDSARGLARVRMAYDAMGNRIRIDTDIDSLGVQQHSTGWYAYDAMNRQILVNGVAPDQAGSQGRVVQYDLAGRRISETWVGNAIVPDEPPPPSPDDGGTSDGLAGDGTSNEPTPPASNGLRIASGLTTARYLYDDQNRLTTMLRDGVLVEERRHDAAGRLTFDGAGGILTTDQIAQLNAGVAQADQLPDTQTWNTYDSNGQLRHVQTNNADGSVKSSIDYFYDDSGRVTSYQVHVPGDDGYTNTFTYAYDVRDSDLIAATYGSSTLYQAGASYRQYDANGYLTGITDQANGANNRSYANDGQGIALEIRQGSALQRQLVANGEVLGRYGTGPNPVQGKDSDNNPLFATGADLNFTWQVMNGQHPGTQPGSYTVSAGDSLQSIARQQYGDSRLWYLIADANGLAASSALQSGQKLNLPSILGTSADRADTFKPYDASQLIGDTTPTMPPPPPDDGGCGVLGLIVVVVVAVVVTIASSGAAAPEAASMVGAGTAGAASASIAASGYFATGLSALAGEYGVGTAIVAGAAGGAAGSIASQLVGIGLGVQDGFSWSGVALGAISTAVGGGLAKFVPFEGAVGSLSNTVARTALGNVVTQGIGVVTGLQSTFNWTSVAASAVGSGVGWEVGDALGTHASAFANAEFTERLLKTSLSGFAAAATTAVARGGRIAVQQVAVDAFGNALGNSLVEADWRGIASEAVATNAQPLRVPAAEVDADGRTTTSYWDTHAMLYASNDIQDPLMPRVMTDAGGGGSFTRDDLMRFEKASYKAGDFSEFAPTRDDFPTSDMLAPENTLTAEQQRYKFGPNEAYRSALELAAARTGFDPAQVAAIVNAEAATRMGIWDPESRNGTSSAYGLTQFLEGTWLDEARRPGTALNELARQNGWLGASGKVLPEYRNDLLQLRSDPGASIVAAAEYMQYNLKQMDARGLIPVTATPDERIQYGYIAHHEGLGGAASLLTGSISETKASNFLDQQAGKKADVWRQRFDTNSGAYKAWLFDYATRRVNPQLYRVNNK